jgi:acyl-CoA reductase-like NAD-dependent aldehyde dehydrogenase
MNCVNFIDNNFTNPTSKTVEISVISPKNGETVGTLYSSTVEDIEKAVQSSKKAFGSWRYFLINKANSLLIREF